MLDSNTWYIVLFYISLNHTRIN